MTRDNCPYCAPLPCCGVHDVNDELRLLEQQAAEADDPTIVLLNPHPPADLFTVLPPDEGGEA